MPHDDDERITRLENAIWGKDDHGGVIGKVMQIENELEHMNATLSAINANLSKIVWIIIGAVVVAILGLVIRPVTSSAAPTNNSTRVQVGSAADAQHSLVSQSARNYLTVAEVADREDRTERYITQLIEDKRIHPAPTKPRKTWEIPKAYTILTADPEPLRTDPNPSEPLRTLPSAQLIQASADP